MRTVLAAALLVLAAGSPSRADIPDPDKPPTPGNPTDPMHPVDMDDSDDNDTTTPPDTTTTPPTTPTTTIPTIEPTPPAPVVVTPAPVQPQVNVIVQDRDDNLFTRYGVGAFVGGGVSDFSDQNMRDTTGTAGVWDLRLGVGIDRPIGIEALYQGGISSIDALGLDTDARLLSSSFEGNLHVNFLPGPVQPYAFGGLGWTRFSLTNVNSNTSDIQDDDDVLTVPLGAGVQFHYAHMLLDLRGTYRVTTFENLVPTTTDTAQDLSSWTVSAQGGFVF